MQESIVWIAGTALVLFVALDAFATVAVLRSGMFTRGQKFMQLLLVWLVPLISAALALYFSNEPISESRARLSSEGPVSETPFIGREGREHLHADRDVSVHSGDS